MTDRAPPTDPATPPRGLSWRDPVLWLVVGPPLAAVLGGLATVWIAATHRDPLVTDTVRKVGVSWQEAAPAPATPAAATSAPTTGAPTTVAPSSPTPAPDEASDGDGG